MGQERFAGQVALVTGASRGIGFGIAQRLVAEGARVCITGRNTEALDSAVAELGGPDHAIGVAGKADRPDHQQETVERTVDTFGRLDLLVNNAGINPTYGPMIELDLDAARKIFEVNALAALAWTQWAHKSWLGEHGGAVVNVSSVAGERPAPGIGFYGASKAMLSHITAELAVELGPHIRVNAVAPAVVKTRFAAALYEDNEDGAAQIYPMRRLGVPGDVAGAAAFLLSADAAWLTGQTVVVDGGVTQTGGM
ncbi:SDR family oxidoreductase [Lipingzhangella sp. LS1_29]|uniref:SDR family oxidoreductase n=1 Tax=Lipingzhangella rawalii TaxID=2055835 RepID=A0ABU2H8A5_9ACTN|nr:SDR family oxidoreductase [Lipingzhangella rawalii]MDS1271529.1 SDR family oxidoreductase [Lipingzhangella rawalii]